jgi:hypothetical protein
VEGGGTPIRPLVETGKGSPPRGENPRKTLEAAYLEARRKGGAPGEDGETFECIEETGREEFLARIAEELRTGTYRPRPYCGSRFDRPVITATCSSYRRSTAFPRQHLWLHHGRRLSWCRP